MAQPTDALPTLLHGLFYWARVQPQAICFTQPVSRTEVVDYRWAEVAAEVRRMASHLRSLDLPAQSRIAILGKNSAHWIMADLAIWAAGHVSVPIYPTANAETVRYVLEHSESRLLFLGKLDEFWNIVAPGIPDALPRIRLPLSPAVSGALDWASITAAAVSGEEVAERRPEELATVIYTSGSTGQPKGVMMSFGAMIATPRGLSQRFPVSTADRFLSYLPLAHAAERAVVEASLLYAGLRVYFAYSLETFLEDLRRARPTLFFSVPRLWTRFYQGICEKLPPARQKLLFRLPLVSRLVKKKILRQLGLEHVRFAITGSAPLSPALVSWYRELGLELLEGYAMTENFSYSHGNHPALVRAGTVGPCMPGVECRIEPSGEILVKSPGNLMGYYKDPQKTAEDLLPDGFFRTGDMGQVDADGCLKITGRVKELFKTGKGKYVAPVPIENRLGDHPLVEIACVTGVGLPQPYALIQLPPEWRARLAAGGGREPVERDLCALREQVNAVLEPHEQLDFLVVVHEPWTMDNGLLTPTMKIKRSAIESRAGRQLAQWSAARQPLLWEQT